MAYSNPFLNRLRDEEQQSRYGQNQTDKRQALEDQRVMSAVGAIQKAPMDLYALLKEEEDRKHKMSQDFVRNKEKKRDQDFGDKKYTDETNYRQKQDDLSRAKEIEVNKAKAAILVPRKDKPNPTIPFLPPIESTQGRAGPKLTTPSEEEMFAALPQLQQAAALPPNIQSMSVRTSSKGPSAPTGPSAPRVPLVEGHAHINETGLPKGESLVEQARPSDYELAQRLFQESPELQRSGRSIDDMAAAVANVRMELDTRSHKQATDHDKLELQRQQILSREKMNEMKVKADALKARAKTAKGPKEFALLGAEAKTLAESRANLEAIATLEDIVASNPTGFLQGIEDAVRGKTQMMDEDRAAFNTRIAELRNQTIKSLAGSAVSESEAARVLSQLPSNFASPKAFAAALQTMKDGYIRRYDSTRDIAQYNSYNREGQNAEQAGLVRASEIGKKPTQGGDKIDSALKRLGL